MFFASAPPFLLLKRSAAFSFLLIVFAGLCFHPQGLLRSDEVRLLGVYLTLRNAFGDTPRRWQVAPEFRRVLGEFERSCSDNVGIPDTYCRSRSDAWQSVRLVSLSPFPPFFFN